MKSPHWSPPLLTLIVTCIGFALLSTGCTSVQVTEDTTGEYRLNELRVTVDQAFEPVYAAVKEAMPDHGLFLTGDEKQVVTATLTGRDSSDHQVTVKVAEIKPGQTSVKIRYGLTGNLAQAQMLYAKIEQHL